MQDLLSFFSGIFVAAVTAVGTVKTAQAKAKSKIEDVYADHTQELFNRVDKLTTERDDLKAQVIQLQHQVSDLQDKIDSLTKAIHDVKGGLDNDQTQIK